MSMYPQRSSFPSSLFCIIVYKVTFLINENAKYPTTSQHIDSTCLHTSQFRYSMIFTFFPSELFNYIKKKILREKTTLPVKKKYEENSKKSNSSYSIWKAPCQPFFSSSPFLFSLFDPIPSDPMLTLSLIENGNKSNLPCFCFFPPLIELMAFK